VGEEFSPSLQSEEILPDLPLRRKVEVDIVLGCDRNAIECGWLIAPLAKRGDNLFVDSVADRLYNSLSTTLPWRVLL